MLNIGQVVYDYTNGRVVIFAGLEMLQNQKTGKCHSESGFILKDGTFVHLKGDDKTPFKYTNFTKDGKPFVGSFVNKCGCNGCYFGIIDGNDAEVKVWAKEAIEEAEAIIAEHGLNAEVCESYKEPYTRYHIGPIKEYKSKMTISTPKADMERAQRILA
jgi:hypothetical protein